MTKPAYRGAWPKVRLLILARDNHTCRIRAMGCTLRATEVDHIIPVAQGGARLDPRNLRAACTHCNASRGGSTRRPAAQVNPVF
jgi:5-methylcytosine-specific restriction endonuclease McrA